MMMPPEILAEFDNLWPEKHALFAMLWEEEKEVRRTATTWTHPALEEEREFLLYRMWSAKHHAEEWDRKWAAYQASKRLNEGAKT